MCACAWSTTMPLTLHAGPPRSKSAVPCHTPGGLAHVPYPDRRRQLSRTHRAIAEPTRKHGGDVGGSVGSGSGALSASIGRRSRIQSVSDAYREKCIENYKHTHIYIHIYLSRFLHACMYALFCLASNSIRAPTRVQLPFPVPLPPIAALGTTKRNAPARALYLCSLCYAMGSLRPASAATPQTCQWILCTSWKKVPAQALSSARYERMHGCLSTLSFLSLCVYAYSCTARQAALSPLFLPHISLFPPCASSAAFLLVSCLLAFCSCCLLGPPTVLIRLTGPDKDENGDDRSWLFGQRCPTHPYPCACLHNAGPAASG